MQLWQFNRTPPIKSKQIKVHLYGTLKHFEKVSQSASQQLKTLEVTRAHSSHHT